MNTDEPRRAFGRKCGSIPSFQTQVLQSPGSGRVGIVTQMYECCRVVWVQRYAKAVQRNIQAISDRFYVRLLAGPAKEKRVLPLRHRQIEQLRRFLRANKLAGDLVHIGRITDPFYVIPIWPFTAKAKAAIWQEWEALN